MTDGEIQARLREREPDMDFLESCGYTQCFTEDIWYREMWGKRICVGLTPDCEWAVSVMGKDDDIEDLEKVRVAYIDGAPLNEMLVWVERATKMWFSREREYEGVSFIDISLDYPIRDAGWMFYIYAEDGSVCVQVELPKSKPVERELFRAFGTNVFTGHSLVDLLYGVSVMVGSPRAKYMYKEAGLC